MKTSVMVLTCNVCGFRQEFPPADPGFERNWFSPKFPSDHDHMAKHVCPECQDKILKFSEQNKVEKLEREKIMDKRLLEEERMV